MKLSLAPATPSSRHPTPAAFKLRPLALACLLACAGAPAWAVPCAAPNEAALLACVGTAGVTQIDMTNPYTVASSVTLPATITLNTNGLNVTFNNLIAHGPVATGGGGTLTLLAGQLDLGASGGGSLSITAPLASPVFIFGASTNTGTTQLATGAGLNFQTNGRLGSGSVVNDGRLGFFQGTTYNMANDMSGTGEWVLGSSTTVIYTGTATLGGHVNIGTATLQIGNGGAAGSVATSSFDDSGALIFNTSSDQLISSAINGPGTLRQAGTGRLILTNDNTGFTGGTTINAGGTLQLGNGGGAGGLGTSPIINNGALVVNRSNAAVVSGNISGTGTLTQSGSGVTMLLGTNTYSGTTTISSGALQIGAGGTTGTLGTGNVVNNGTLNFSRTNTYTVSNNISGTGGLLQFGTGVTKLLGTNTYSGTTSITAGTLQAGAANTFSASSAVNVGASGTLDLNNFDQTIGSLTGSGAISLGTGVLTSGANNSSTTYSGTITGGGGLVKNGTGTLSLTGASAIGGSTTVNGGVLEINSAAAIGTGGIALNGSQLTGTANLTLNNFFLDFAAGQTGTLAAATGTVLTFNGANITVGAGGVMRIGDGVNNGVVELGNNAGSFGSTLLVASGTLRAAGTGLDVVTNGIGLTNVAAGATLDYNGFSGSILNLLGAGTIATGSSAAQTLALRQGSFSGAITGAGSVTTAASGALTLSGDSSYTGTTTNAGTLQVGIGGTTGTLGTGAITNNGALTVNRSNTYSMANNIGGTGTLTQAGSGNLILLGANTYSGATTVNAGTLSVNGSIFSETTVNSGGTLGGSGAVANVTVASGGILAPGNSIGNLTVNGNLIFNAGSIYRVETDAAGNADRTIVNGTPTLGGTVEVRAGSGTYARNTSYTILTSTGFPIGTFAGVTSNLAFLTPTLSYLPNSVVLNLAANGVSYGSVAQTANQRNTGNYLNGLAGSGGAAGALVTQIDGLSAEQARTAFDSLSGSQYAAGSQVAGALGRNFGNALDGRMANAGGADGGGGFAVGALKYDALAFSSPTAPWGVAVDAPAQMAGMFAAGGASSASLSAASSLSGAPASMGSSGNSNSGGNNSGSDLGLRETGRAASAEGFARSANWGANTANQNGLWGQALGTGGRTRGDGNGAGSSYRAGGFMVGVDRSLNEHWLIGVAGGYQRANWDASTNGIAPANGKIETPQGAVYARYTSGPWMLNVAGSYADNKFDTTRSISIGSSTTNASSTHHGGEWGFSTQAEYALAAGAWQVRPLAGLRYAHLREDGFTESGANGLSIDARTTQSTTLSAGLRLLRAFRTGNGEGGVELRAIASHLYGDNDSPITARLGNTAASFTTTGTPLKRDALTLGAGLSAKLGRNFSGFIDTSYEARGSGQNAYAIGAGLRYLW